MSALSAPGYCTFTATTRPSCQTALCTWPIDAAAAGTVVELGEPRAPVVAELLAQDRVDRLGRQRGSRLLELGEGRSVRAGHLLGHGRLEDAHGLAHLHGAALELAEDPEHLLGRACLELGLHDLRGLAADALAEAPRRASRVRRRHRGDLHAAGQGVPRDLGHGTIVACAGRAARGRVRSPATGIRTADAQGGPRAAGSHRAAGARRRARTRRPRSPGASIHRRTRSAAWAAASCTRSGSMRRARHRLHRLRPLDREQRPGRVGVPPVQVGAPQARGDTGHHQRPHDRAVAQHSDVQVRPVLQVMVEVAGHVRVRRVGEDGDGRVLLAADREPGGRHGRRDGVREAPAPMTATEHRSRAARAA